jgi:DNA-binding IclR family transcriptional regulator
MMRDLAEHGLLQRLEPDGSYVLGTRLVEIARSALRPADLVEAALPIMKDLRNSTGETVALHVRRMTARICVAQVQSQQPIRRVVPVGFTVPVHYGATGEVLLGGMSTAELDGYLGTLGLSAQDRRALMDRLKLLDERGWLTATESWAPGLAGVAAPVRVAGRTVASLSVSGPSYRLDEVTLRMMGPAVADAAARIGADLAEDDIPA